MTEADATVGTEYVQLLFPYTVLVRLAQKLCRNGCICSNQDRLAFLTEIQIMFVAVLYVHILGIIFHFYYDLICN